VVAPRKIKNLIAIEARADYGTIQLGRVHSDLWKNKGDSNHRALVNLFKNPVLWPGLLVYCYVRIRARHNAKLRLQTNSFVWERDDTSRAAQAHWGAR
jgi:hypothetical protein